MAKGIPLPVVQSGLEASIQQGVKNVGKISIPATIDPSAFKSLAQPLGKVSGLATEFEKSIAASNARVLAFGASVGIINGVQNAFSDLIRTGIEVQKTLADIAAISGQGGKELSKFGDALFDIGKLTGQSFKTASQAALEFSRQGLSVEETLKRTTDALTLTRFTTLNAAEAVDVLTAAANSFSDTGITTAEIINKLVAVDTKFAVSAEDLAKGLARAGSIAQEVGVNFDELNAAVTIAQERTARGGAVIGNALKTIFTRIRSDETVQALRDIGVESLNAQGQLKGAVPLLKEVAEKIQSLSGGERVQILESIASKYNINILSALLNDLNGANSKFAEVVGISATASNQAYERQIELNKALAAELNKATVSATQLFNKLAEIGVTDSLSTLLKFVNDIINSFNKLLDSEGAGGNIARGLIKGISDVFFTVGLPIIGAIFVKLTADIAKFGVESLKTILGINQQVRERQALEQAVVNTLIRDQEIMATILSLSTNRAKQEEYLLSVYNRQLAALQQVQNIATSVTPALIAGGLTATSGQIRKRGAGGYLPAQEAADIRRGVGGASPSSKVVSIPNFAFGGGKRGTMIANTSEYVVPNFANGGSAVFNKDMVRAYGLPDGARKISAAGGYVPNFAEANDAYIYAKQGVPPEGRRPIITSLGAGFRGKNSVENLRAVGYRQMTPKELAEYNKSRSSRKTASSHGIAAMLVPDSSPMFSSAEPKPPYNDTYSAIEFPIYGISEQALKNQTENIRTGNYGSVPKFSDILKQEIDRLGIGFASQLTGGQVSQSVYDQAFKKSYGAKSALDALSGGLFEASVRALTYPESVIEKGDNTLDFPNLGTAAGQILQKVFNIKGGERAADLKGSKSDSIQRKFVTQTVENKLIRETALGKSAGGYIPNFATGGPLEDAINREMAAGVSPSKIRVTQDGRLRNSQNPNGLAVINTRDEPNGKIPNFASSRYPAGTVIDGKKVGGQFASEEQLKALEKSAENTKIGFDKMLVAFGGLTLATNILQSSFKDTQSTMAQFAVGLSQAAQGAVAFSSLGSLLKDSKIGQGLIGKIGAQGGPITKIAGFAGSVVKRLPLAGALYGAGSSIIESLQASALAKTENAPAKQAGIESVKDVTKETEIRGKLSELGKKIIANPADDKTNAAYDELKRKLAEIVKTKKQEGEQEKKTTEETRKRIALASVINQINETFAGAQNKRDLERAKNFAKLIEGSADLTESQKQEQDLQQKLVDIENKKIDLKESTRNKILEEITSASKLATVDRSSLEILVQKVKEGKPLEGIYKELAKLETEGAVKSAEKIQSLLSQERIQQQGLNTQKATTELVERANIADRERRKSLQAVVKAQQDLLAFTQEYTNLTRESAGKQKEFEIKKPTIEIERKIAQKPFATREQSLALALAKDKARVEEEEYNLAKKRDDEINSSNQKFRKNLASQLDGVSDLTSAQRNAFRQRIIYAETEEDAYKAAVEAGGFEKNAEAQKTFFSNLLLQNKLRLKTEEETTKEYERQFDFIDRIESRESKIARLRASSPAKAGRALALEDIEQEAYNFSETFNKNTTLAFRDGLRDAMSAAISQTDDLGAALQNVAKNFLQTMQTAFLQNAANNVVIATKALGLAKGGLVSGGSGYRDDIPAMLTGGEFVMRKSAVQKYGAANLERMNNGGFFLPGVRGGKEISGYKDLTAFANQTTTSGATDVLMGGKSMAFANLEDQSSKLSAFALLNEDDIINQEIRSAQEQALNIITEREKYRTAERKAFQKQIASTLASAALSYFTSSLVAKKAVAEHAKENITWTTPYGDTHPNWIPNSRNASGWLPPNINKAYGGMIRRYAAGGPTDDIPALLMGGEYIMNRQTTNKYGKAFFDSMNQGRLPRFADGGQAPTSEMSFAEKAAGTAESKSTGGTNVSINISVAGGATDVQAQGETNQKGIDYKKMGEQIKQIVIQTINEEKRLGGSLRSR